MGTLHSNEENQQPDIIANDITNFCFRLLQEPYTAAPAMPKTKFLMSLTIKDGNYNVEDVMKSIMDTYEARYNEIVKEHENGDREVSYELTGKRSLTLDEDLAGLDEAFKMRLANLEGYIACQQTNRAFENSDSSWYFNRNSSQNEGKTQDRIQLFDTEYRDSALSIMEQTREKFLAAFKSFGYKKGAAIGILA